MAHRPQGAAGAERIMDDWLLRYGPPAGERGPERFVEEVLGIVPKCNPKTGVMEGGIDEWQRDILRDYGRGERRISIRACHGPGKTAVIAWIILYQLLFRFPQKTVATAPTRGQLFDALFAEVMMWFTHLPQPIQELFATKSDRIELLAAPDESFFSARTARQESPEALQGVHSEHVLLVVDEASGVPEAIYEASAGSMSGHNATTILASNPTKTSGFFFDTHHKLRDMWKCYQIGAADSARVTDDFVADIAARYGEDSNAYRVRVLGEFPKSDDDTIIAFELVEGASKRDIVKHEDAEIVWGLDVARFGDDVSVLSQRSSYTQDWQKTYKGLDTMELVGRVKAGYDELLPSKKPKEILVDVIGLGAGVVDRLRELDLPARGINVSEASAMSERFRNLRAELWFKARDWLEEKGSAISEGQYQLERELVVPRYKFTSNGKLQVESKEDMKKRGHKSPNHADAFILTFASNALRAQMGRKGNPRKGEPIRRNLPGIV